VTVCHGKTDSLPGLVKGADILVGAVGIAQFMKTQWIKKEAVVVDAGYHNGGIGDIQKENLENIAGAYTPVPGGVGPMTIATLIQQTVEACFV
jgi:methylenetetrahydrofolate dehydrogenase (NADP+)/methenyltetrahydrofolate cyclohydrolase